MGRIAQILSILLLLFQVSFAQLGQTGFNNTDSELLKQLKSVDQCYIDWLKELGPEHNAQRYPSGTGSRSLKPNNETFINAYTSINIWQKCGVERIMYVATVAEPEMSLELALDFKESFPNVGIEYDNESWLYLNGVQEFFFKLGSAIPYFANKVYADKAYEYVDNFKRFYFYAKEQGYDLKNELIWTAPYPNSSHAKKYLDILYKELGGMGFKQCSFHVYTDSQKDLEYIKKRSSLIPPDLIIHGTELGFDFGHSASLEKNSNLAFTKTHKDVLTGMFEFFNQIFATTWYHYSVGTANSNYPALVVNNGICEHRLQEFLK